MTSDSIEPTRKPARRRVTRSAGGPAAPGTGAAREATPPADLTSGAPVADRPEAPTAAPQQVAPEQTAPEQTAPEVVAEAPVRRSRRVSRPVSTPAPEPETSAPAPLTLDLPVPEQRAPRKRAAEKGAAPATGTGLALSDIVLPERGDDVEAPAARVTAGRSQATGSRRAVRTLADIELPSSPASATGDEATAKEPAAPRAATRTRRATAAADTPAPATEQHTEQQGAPDDAGTSPRSRKRVATRKTAAATAAEPESAGPAPESALAAPEAGTPEPAADVPPARATRRRAGAAPTEQPTAAGAPATKPASPEPSPASRTTGSTAPRLATTAMLFQAPDLAAAPRRSRRVQAPAGPPGSHTPLFGTDAVQAAAERDAQTRAAGDRATEGQPAETPSESGSEAEGAPAPARSRRTRASGTASSRSRSARTAPAPAEDAATSDAATSDAASSEPAEAVEPVVLTGQDAAAAREVAAIEAELEAEGVELVELGPEDLLEDDADGGDLDADVEPDSDDDRPRRRRRRGGRGRRGGRRTDDVDGEDAGSDEADDDADDERGAEQAPDTEPDADEAADDEGGERGTGRRRRRRRGTRTERAETQRGRSSDEVTGVRGSTRLEAKRQRRREGRDAGRRRQTITEAEFLARRESVSRSMVVRERDGRTQIAVLEDGVLVEHYVSQQSQVSMVGNVYLGRVQNVLPSMEAAFVDVGKGRNAVLYAGEVNWDAAGLEGGQSRRIEQALKSGDSVLVQVTKDPIGHKGARLTSQVTLAGRYLVLVPGGGMTGISRKLPDVERTRLKKILRDIVPEDSGVIVRTAAEGASEDELRADVERLQSQWAAITAKAGKSTTSAPALLQGEPDLAIRVVRDIFNDDFSSLIVQGDGAWQEVSTYVEELAPDLRERVTQWAESTDVFAVHRVDEQLAKGMDRKVWLPSGGSLVIDRTEAMTVIDVNTGKFTGAGGTLEETVTRNNLEAAEEIVRQLRLRDIGGIIVIDFIDMVLESNRDLVLRRLVECLGRDRTKHQVAEVTSLGLVQMTRKRVGQGLVEAFSETCEHCKGRGFIVHSEPNERGGRAEDPEAPAATESKRSRRKRPAAKAEPVAHPEVPKLPDDKSQAREAVKATLATIAAAAAHAHDHKDDVPAPTEA